MTWLCWNTFRSWRSDNKYEMLGAVVANYCCSLMLVSRLDASVCAAVHDTFVRIECFSEHEEKVSELQTKSLTFALA